MPLLSRAETPSTAPDRVSGASRSTLGLGILLVLAVGHFSAAVVRNLPSVVAPEIQSTFAIGDGTFGLLHGPAFVVVNVVAIIVAAAFVDRVDRFRVMGLCMAGWSLGSLAFAFAPTAESLFAARVLVGLSQAAFTPCAVSLIIDRCGTGFGRPLSVFTAGSALGRSAGIMLGGSVLALVAMAPAVMDGVSDWRLACALLSLPSLALAVVLLGLKDRRAVPTAQGPRFADTLAWGWRRRSALGPYLLAAGALILITQATTAWMPSVFRRVLELETAEAAMLAGLAVLIGAPLGHAVGGWTVDRWSAVGRSPPGLMALALVAVSVLGIGLAFADSAVTLFLAACGLAMALGIGGLAALAGFQPITPSHRRGAVTALYLAAVGLIGMGLGPPMVGLVSQQAFGSGTGLLAAMAVVVVGVALIGVLAAWRAASAWRHLGKPDD